MSVFSSTSQHVGFTVGAVKTTGFALPVIVVARMAAADIDADSRLKYLQGGPKEV